MAGEYQAFVDILTKFNVRKFTVNPCEYLTKVLKAFDDLLANEDEAKILFDNKSTMTEFGHFIDKLFIAHDEILDKLRDPMLIKYILKITEISMVKQKFYDLYTILKYIEERNYETRLSLLHPELDPKLDEEEVLIREKQVKQRYAVFDQDIDPDDNEVNAEENNEESDETSEEYNEGYDKDLYVNIDGSSTSSELNIDEPSSSPEPGDIMVLLPRKSPEKDSKLEMRDLGKANDNELESKVYKENANSLAQAAKDQTYASSIADYLHASHLGQVPTTRQLPIIRQSANHNGSGQNKRFPKKCDFDPYLAQLFKQREEKIEKSRSYICLANIAREKNVLLEEANHIAIAEQSLQEAYDLSLQIMRCNFAEKYAFSFSLKEMAYDINRLNSYRSSLASLILSVQNKPSGMIPAQIPGQYLPSPAKPLQFPAQHVLKSQTEPVFPPGSMSKASPSNNPNFRQPLLPHFANVKGIPVWPGEMQVTQGNVTTTYVRNLSADRVQTLQGNTTHQPVVNTASAKPAIAPMALATQQPTIQNSPAKVASTPPGFTREMQMRTDQSDLTYRLENFKNKHQLRVRV